MSSRTRSGRRVRAASRPDSAVGGLADDLEAVGGEERARLDAEAGAVIDDEDGVHAPIVAGASGALLQGYPGRLARRHCATPSSGPTLRRDSGSTLLPADSPCVRVPPMSGRGLRLADRASSARSWRIAGEALSFQSGQSPSAGLLHLAIGLTYLYGGLAIWGHEPTNRTGALMTAVGLTWFIAPFAHSEIPVVNEVGLALEDTSTVLLLALVLAYPSGRLDLAGRPGGGRDPRRSARPA